MKHSIVCMSVCTPWICTWPTRPGQALWMNEGKKRVRTARYLRTTGPAVGFSGCVRIQSRASPVCKSTLAALCSGQSDKHVPSPCVPCQRENESLGWLSIYRSKGLPPRPHTVGALVPGGSENQHKVYEGIIGLTSVTIEIIIIYKHTLRHTTPPCQLCWTDKDWGQQRKNHSNPTNRSAARSGMILTAQSKENDKEHNQSV